MAGIFFMINSIGTSPLVSVCIANYNGENIISDCVGSVLAQDCDFPFEIIVHDDASTDSSVEIIRRDFPHVLLLEAKENVGFCISNNKMVDVSRGEFILLLNNDAALAPDALSTLYAHAQRQQCQGIIGLPQYDWQTWAVVDRGCLLDPFYNPVPNLDANQTDVAMVIGACLWIPHSLWDELGGFPAWFESVAEDLYLCCRAKLAGYPVQVTSGSNYRHWQGKSFGGNRVDGNKLVTTYHRRRLSERNKTFVMALCSSRLRLFLTLPLHLLLLALEGLVLSIAKRDPLIWREVYAGVFVSLFKYGPKLIWLRKRIISTSTHSCASNLGGTFTYFPRKLQMLLMHGLPNIQ
jgi:GT2 family glycosyltransferase